MYQIERKRKEKILFYLTLLVAIFLMVFLASSLKSPIKKNIETTQNKEAIVSADKIMELSLKVKILPKDSPTLKEFNDMLDTGQPTLTQYNKISREFDDYIKQQKKKAMPIDTSKLTELQKAELNLQAFDEVGSAIVPAEKMHDVREKLVEKINKLKKEDKNTKKLHDSSS